MSSPLAKPCCRLVAAICILAGSSAAVQAQQDKPYHLTLLGIPSALTLPSGSGFVQGTYTSDRHGSGLGADGSSAMGLGFGDLRTGFGGHVVAEITSFKDDFGDSGYLTFQGATRIRRAAIPAFVGLSVDRLVAWGDATAEDPEASLMLTAFPRVSTPAGGSPPLMFTVGLRMSSATTGGGGGGGGAAPVDPPDPTALAVVAAPSYSANAVTSGTSFNVGDYNFGLFGGVGVGISEDWAASASWNVDHAIFGVSYRPRAARNLNVSLSLVDPFEQVGNAHVAVSVSYLFGQQF